MASRKLRSDVRSTISIRRGPVGHATSPTGFGKNTMPNIKRMSKYDHGAGPKEFTHMNSPVAGTGRSQKPHQVTVDQYGRARNTGR